MSIIKKKTIYNNGYTLRIEVNKPKPDNTYKFKIGIIYYKSGRYVKKSESYYFSVELKSLCGKHFYEFCNFLEYDKTVMESIKKNEFNYLNLPKEKSREQLMKESLSHQIKQINRNLSTDYYLLKIWRDQYSFLKEDKLIPFLSKNENKKIDAEIDKLKTNTKRKEALKRKIYRWCIRGLDVKKAIKKEIEDSKRSKYFAIKARKTQKSYS